MLAPTMFAVRGEADELDGHLAAFSAKYRAMESELAEARRANAELVNRNRRLEAQLVAAGTQAAARSERSERSEEAAAGDGVAESEGTGSGTGSGTGTSKRRKVEQPATTASRRISRASVAPSAHSEEKAKEDNDEMSPDADEHPRSKVTSSKQLRKQKNPIKLQLPRKQINAADNTNDPNLPPTANTAVQKHTRPLGIANTDGNSCFMIAVLQTLFAAGINALLPAPPPVSANEKDLPFHFHLHAILHLLENGGLRGQSMEMETTFHLANLRLEGDATEMGEKGDAREFLSLVQEHAGDTALTIVHGGLQQALNGSTSVRSRSKAASGVIAWIPTSRSDEGGADGVAVVDKKSWHRLLDPEDTANQRLSAILCFDWNGHYVAFIKRPLHATHANANTKDGGGAPVTAPAHVWYFMNDRSVKPIHGGLEEVTRQLKNAHTLGGVDGAPLDVMEPDVEEGSGSGAGTGRKTRAGKAAGTAEVPVVKTTTGRKLVATVFAFAPMS